MVASAEVSLGRKTGNKWGVNNNLYEYSKEIQSNSLGYEPNELFEENF